MAIDKAVIKGIKRGLLISTALILMTFVVLYVKLNNPRIENELLSPLRDIAEHYGADKVSVFKFFTKDTVSAKLNGLDYTHLYCSGEYATKNAISMCQYITEQPIIIYGKFWESYNLNEDCMFKVPDYEDMSDPSVKEVMKNMNVKSSYSRLVYDNNYQPIGAIAMTFSVKKVDVEDFTYFNGVINDKIRPILLMDDDN